MNKTILQTLFALFFFVPPFAERAACQTTVFVSVNMSAAAIDPAGVFVATPSGDAQMVDGGNGNWSAALVAPNFSTIKYRFKNGAATEPTADLSSCGAADGSGGFWRTATVATQDLTVPIVCFGKCGGCPLPCATDPDGLVCENFNTYALAPIGSQTIHFSGQNGVDGGPEDPSVSAAQSSDGGNSLKISGDNTGGATPNSTVLRLGNKSTGKFDLAWKMFCPTGKTAFFNIDSDEAGFGPILTVVVSPTGDVFLISGNGQTVGKWKLSNDSWVDFRLLADLDGDVAQLRIGQNFSQNMAFSGSLGGLNFSGIAANTEFFIDEIEFRQNALFVVSLDDCQSAFDLAPYLAGGATTVSTALFDNSTATAETGLAGVDCFTEILFGGTEEIQNSLWYKFEGNGRTYQVQTAPCDAGTAYLDGGDTQMAAYTGADCASLVPIGCNDDLGFSFAGDFRAGLVIASEIGKSYRLLVDGFDGTAGKFCLQFTQFQQITFQVDASQIGTIDPLGMHIQGSWDGWTVPHPMTSAGNGAWQYSITIPPGAIVEWKYQNGPGGWEPDAALAACGVANTFGGFNRVLNVTGDLILPAVCFSRCDTCATTGWYDDCAFAENISAYFGQGLNVVSTSPTYTNENATTGLDDPTEGFECFNEGPATLDRTTFFKFLGDGKVYQITTVPCDADNYITDGDTQMAVYEGDDCQFGASVTCNDDLSAGGDPDYRSRVTMQTVAGQWYTIMMDGWGDAVGEFCIEIVEITPIGCAEAMLGEPESDAVTVCFDETTTLFINENNTVVPNIGPVAGFCWIITTEPLPTGLANSPVDSSFYFGASGIAPVVYPIPIGNDGSAQPGIYYITPVLVSGAVLNPNGIDPLDVTGGCFIFGTSIAVTIVEELDFIAANGAVTPETAPGNNGAITLTVSGGTGSYIYEWSNGSSNQNLTGLKAGSYTVTITDATGCVEEEKTFIVPFIIATDNLPGVSALSVMPNPTGGPLHFSVQLIENQSVSVRLVNALGQIIADQKFAAGENPNGIFDLSKQPSGVFSLRFEIAGRTTERRIVLVK